VEVNLLRTGTLKQRHDLDVAQALLSAFGPPGSAAALAGLANGGHAVLRAATHPPIIRALANAYGGPGAPAMLSAVPAADMLTACLRASFARDDTFRALLDAFGAAPGSGTMLALLAAGNASFPSHALLMGAVTTGSMEQFSAVLQGYGEPGCAAAQAALAAGGHAALLAACTLRTRNDPEGNRRARLEVLLDAYGGGPGSAAVLEALTAGDHAALRAACGSSGLGGACSRHVVEALLEAYGAPGGRPILLEGLAAADPVGRLGDSCGDSCEAAVIAAYGQAGRATLMDALLRRPMRQLCPGFPFALLAVQLPGMWRRRAVDWHGYGDSLESDEDEPPAAGPHPSGGASGSADGASGSAGGASGSAGGASGSAGGANGSAAGAAIGAATLPLRRLLRRDVAGCLLVSQHEKREMVLPLLLTVSRLPPQVAEPVRAYLQAHPWSLYADEQWCWIRKVDNQTLEWISKQQTLEWTLEWMAR